MHKGGAPSNHFGIPCSVPRRLRTFGLKDGISTFIPNSRCDFVHKRNALTHTTWHCADFLFALARCVFAVGPFPVFQAVCDCGNLCGIRHSARSFLANHVSQRTRRQELPSALVQTGVFLLLLWLHHDAGTPSWSLLSKTPQVRPPLCEVHLGGPDRFASFSLVYGGLDCRELLPTLFHWYIPHCSNAVLDRRN